MNQELLKDIIDKIDVTGEAPMSDPERQYYFIAKAKEKVSALKEELGRTPTACVNTFGCQMNARDSEKIVGILEIVGYEMIEKELLNIPKESVRKIAA